MHSDMLFLTPKISRPLFSRNQSSIGHKLSRAITCMLLYDKRCSYYKNNIFKILVEILGKIILEKHVGK